MVLSATIDAVERMQKHIKTYVNECFEINDIVGVSHYSKRHAIRIFKDLLGKTPMQYVRSIRLTASAKGLAKKQGNVLEVALDSGYESHEGFSRAFANEFGILPKRYQQEKPPIRFFVQYPVRHCYSHYRNAEGEMMKQESLPGICTVTIVKRPKRRLMIMRAQKAHDYWSFCEEKGCDWEGLFDSIYSKIDSGAILTLPESMVADGTTNCAAGIEIPSDYSGKVIDGCELIELDECDMMVFQSRPFDDEDDYDVAIGEVNKAIREYDPTPFGYEYALDIAPRYNYGASSSDRGIRARQAMPVKELVGETMERPTDRQL